ncbi:MAG: nickel pincer cofactor biosynthesis protein LarC [Dehalococcoidia bacterium]|nr:nickel pincer cofactor biosynthesis protein LarC [Dehalococcoidia bacterium]MSQ16794.1 nickel pincer cofactor biosynthesis protein LarC [Dehalococcoidia bacterium]
MQVAYIQSIGGASGDMLLGALLDLGLPLDTLLRDLDKLGLEGYKLSARQETRREMRGTHLKVTLADSTRHSPRALLEIVGRSALTQGVKDQAARVLTALWQAESRVHGQPAEALELEELGSIDTLIDVVGFAIGLAQLGVGQVYAAPLVLGEAAPPRRPGGYPNPAPATLELVAMSGAPVAADRPTFQDAGELTTPTGAAIITTLARFERPAMSVRRIGVGLGARDPAGFPNAVRVWLGETAAQPATTVAQFQSGVVLLETNLDDAPGLVLGYTQERLFELGALDVWHTPVQMKKNRPGVVLSALVPASLEAAAVELILRETPTLGVRTRPVERYVARRESVNMESELGAISVKLKWLGDAVVGAAPEFDDCRRIALERGLPFQDVYQSAVAQARRQFLT